MDDIRKRFGKAVRQRRHRLGVSQEAFADLCGLDRTYVGGIERGERNVALVNIEKIACAFRISVLELFRGVSAPRKIGKRKAADNCGIAIRLFLGFFHHADKTSAATDPAGPLHTEGVRYKLSVVWAAERDVSTSRH
jgi:transcriptional regulator with XRE-family HTH domain